MSFLGALSLLAVGCATPKRVERPEPAAPAPTPAPLPAVPAPQLTLGLYAPEEALRDVLSSPLEYVGTGPWPGMHRIHACVFRNERVLVVNAYCTRTEQQAFRIDVYSPARGRVRIYAESKGAVSAHARREYFTFLAESEPVPGPELGLPELSLAMSFAELQEYDDRRYNAFLPVCYGGTEHEQARSGCLGALAPQAHAWADHNRAFLAYASEDWHQIVRAMRAYASQFGRDPD
jgi:hypothetical protein